MKNILYRQGSTTYVEDQYGRLWLCKRKKLRRDSRRRTKAGAKVVHTPIQLIIDLTYEQEIQFFGKSEKTPRVGGEKNPSGEDNQLSATASC